MLKYHYISLILFITLLSPFTSFDVPDNLKSICPQGCKRYFYCDEEKKQCIFKGFFPIYPLELIYIIIVMITSSLATSCGIGGGTVYSTIILCVEEFPPSQAFPISNFLILCSAVVTFISFSYDKYNHPGNQFINFDVALLFGTTMLLGSKFGSILNKILPASFLLVLLIILLIFTTNKTYKNIQRTKARELKLEQEKENLKKKFLARNNNENNKKIEMSNQEINNENSFNQNTREIDNESPISDYISFNKIIAKNSIEINHKNNSNFDIKNKYTIEEEEILNEENHLFNKSIIKFLAIIACLVVIDQFIEGNSKIPSLIGIPRCSNIYWITFILFILICFYMLKIAVEKIKKRIELKKKLLKNFNSKVLDNISNNFSYSISIGILAGVSASTLGISGGIIANPLFVSLGMDPKESSSTSNFLIVITAIETTFLFIMSGQLQIGYSLCLGSLSVTAAIIGNLFILKYINQTGKSSILLIIMEYFIVGSIFIALYKLITLDRHGIGFLGSFFILNQYC